MTLWEEYLLPHEHDPPERSVLQSHNLTIPYTGEYLFPLALPLLRLISETDIWAPILYDSRTYILHETASYICSCSNVIIRHSPEYTTTAKGGGFLRQTKIFERFYRATDNN